MSEQARPTNARRNQRVRKSLKLSQTESFASSLMTGSYDHYVNAFTVFLGATPVQIGWLTALPQLLGGICQLMAVWFGQWVHRQHLIVLSAAVQSASLVLVCLLAVPDFLPSPLWFLLLAITIHCVCNNLIMPHWRAWMGQLVPGKIRGRFFSRRTRISMFTSFVVFLIGGALLTWNQKAGTTWLGFLMVFSIGVFGRIVSSVLLAKMHDNHPVPNRRERQTVIESFKHLYELWSDRDFRRFSFFMAGLSCAVSVSGPFFAVYMLRDLQFTYTLFTLSMASSVLSQFIMLPFWGKLCDRKGNRFVMGICASIIPVVPAMWLIADHYVYIITIQAVGGLAWSGFSLASSNYLYDQKPRHIHFASYSAIHSSLAALAVCIGAIMGGYIISWVPSTVSLVGLTIHIDRPIIVIFVLSSVLRAAIVLWFIPSAPELRISTPASIRELILRVTRFPSISGVMPDGINKPKNKSD